MSDRLLLALAPVAAHRRVAPDPSRPGFKVTVGVVPNPARQSPRVYAALVSGGGVVDNEEVAATLEAGGFAVSPIVLTSDEATFLGSATGEPRRAGAQAWLVTCLGSRTAMVDGRLVCGSPVLQDVPLDLARRDELYDADDLAPAEALAAGARVEPRVVTSDRKGWTPEVLALASRTVAAHEAIVRDLATLDALRRQGALIPADVLAIEARARALVVAQAQPVSSFRRLFPDGENLREVDPIDRMGIEPATTALVLYAIVAVGVAAAVYFLADAWKATARTQTDIADAMGQVAKPLAECAADPTLPEDQREACRKALSEWVNKAPKPPQDPMQSMAEMLRSALPLVGIAAAAVYAGPLMREGAGLFADEVKRRRASRQTLRRAIPAFVQEIA